MPSTIREVARAAGVSVATVSRVFNNSGPVGAATRARIETAARELRYVPNGAARSLITNRTHALGVVLPDLHGEFFSEVIRGVDAAARALGFHLLVSSSHADARDMASALRTLRGRVDALVVMAPEAEADVLDDEIPAGLPAVLLGNGRAGRGLARVSVDNAHGAGAMVRHLAGLGHRRLALIAGAPGNVDAEERLAAVKATAADLGLPAPAVESGAFTEASGYEAARRLLRAGRPDAVFALNDSMALGALGALRDAGLRVPEDVGLAGFDDVPLARFLTPPLTSVHVPTAELGRHAVERALGARAGDGGGGDVRLPVTLRVRVSCGAST